jgi:hypothetical protein
MHSWLARLTITRLRWWQLAGVLTGPPASEREPVLGLEPTGPVRVAGPTLPVGAQWLSLRASSPGSAVEVTADLRDPQGAIRQVAFGTVGAGATVLRTPVPPGRWELQTL